MSVYFLSMRPKYHLDISSHVLGWCCITMRSDLGVHGLDISAVQLLLFLISTPRAPIPHQVPHILQIAFLSRQTLLGPVRLDTILDASSFPVLWLDLTRSCRLCSGSQSSGTMEESLGYTVLSKHSTCCRKEIYIATDLAACFFKGPKN